MFVRAIVLDDGASQAALVAWESLFVPEPIWAETSRRIAAETGIPPERLVLSAVHDHGAPTLPNTNATPVQLAYITTIKNSAVEAVPKRSRNCSQRGLESGRRQRTSTSIGANSQPAADGGSVSTRTGRRTKP